ncbi:phage terminase small subunit [Prodigiosinella aquatilis]|nr:phage terminase small subunit [Prodigiosinella sp. LS101]WJV52940.1 phage terminase small subunit [Prodigiosinella sp. LS101]WJV57295.1 phage terminase small subunit [Pectobacteriaceae bacterium C111]
MTSPARRHLMRIQAEESTRLGGSVTRNLSAYNQMLLKLEEDKRQLKRTQSTLKKAALKRQMLPYYQPWVAGALSAGKGGQDDVLLHIMVWRIDAGEFDGALDIADYAMKNGLVMPKPYKRQTACTVAEEIADTITKNHAAKQPVPVAILQRTLDVTADHDMPDEVRAKVHKILAYGLRDNNDPVLAYHHICQAYQYDDKCGVKKDMEQLERIVRKASAG